TIEPPERPTVRRFELADFNRHPWVSERVSQFFKHLAPWQVDSFLRSQLYSSEFLFLFMPHAVGLAQIVRSQTFEPQSMVVERFIVCEDRTNQEHLEQAADFYDEMSRWAKSHGALRMIVLQHSDVPRALLKKRFKLADIQQTL